MKNILIGFFGILCFSAFTLVNTKINDKALLVGITHYPVTSSLKYSDDDAYRMFAFLKTQQLADKDISILIDEDGTKKNIINRIKQQSEHTPIDKDFTFFYSGKTYSNGIMTNDNFSLSYDEIIETLKVSNAKNNIIIIEGNYNKNVENLISENTTFWFSANEGQEIKEDNNLSQHIFSHFLIKGLKGAADINKDSKTTLVELEKYVSANVKHYTNNSQTPKLLNILPISWEVEKN